MASQHLRRVERKIRALETIRSALADLIERCNGAHRPDCPIIADLSGAEAAAGGAAPSGIRQNQQASPPRRQWQAG